MKVVSVFFLFFTLTLSAHGQAVPGFPLVKNFFSEDYKAHNQNWGFDFDSRGNVYAGNGSGLLRYDGIEWTLYQNHFNNSIFTLAVDDEDQVWVGGKNEIGVFRPQADGSLHYEYLSALLPDSVRETHGRLNQVFLMKDKVFFLAKSYLLVLDKHKKTFEIRKTDRDFYKAHYINDDKYFIQEGAKAFLEVTPKGIEVLANINIRAFINGLFTDSNGQYRGIYTGRGLLNFNPHGEKPQEIFKVANDSINTPILKSISPYSVIKMSNGNIAVGGLTGTVLILDPDFRLLEVIDQRSGLKKEPVTSLAEDRYGNLWIACTEGLHFAELSSPVRVFDKQSGYSQSAIYMTSVRDKKFLTTSEGLFQVEKNNLKKIPLPYLNKAGLRIWDLTPYDDRYLLISTKEGIAAYDIDKDKTEMAFRAFSLFLGSLSDDVPEQFFVTSYEKNLLVNISPQDTGLNKVQELTKLKGYDIRYSARDEKNLWLGSNSSGVIRIPRKSDGAFDFDTPQLYGMDKGLPDLNWNKVLNFQGKILITSEGKLFEYVADTDSLLECTSDYLEEGVVSQIKNGVIRSGNKLIFFEDGKKVFSLTKPLSHALGEKASGMRITNDSVLLYPTSKRLLSSRIDEAKVFEDSYLPPEVNLRTLIIGKDSVILKGHFTKPTVKENDTVFSFTDKQELIPKIPYQFNTLKFTFSSGRIEIGQPLKFRYRLEGRDTTWSALAEKNYCEFQNLSPGTYTLYAEVAGSLEKRSPAFEYTFRVLPPWYRTWWAYCLYLVITGLAVYGIVLLSLMQAAKRQKRLEKLIEERTQEVREQNGKLEKQKNEILSANAQLNQQNEEIHAQSENLKTLNLDILSKSEQVQKAFEDIRTLSEIGQELTGLLHLEDILKNVYERISNLMSADGFGVGIYNPFMKRLEFDYFIEFGKAIPSEYDDLGSKRLSVRSFKNRETIVIKDVQEEFKHAFEDQAIRSLVYLPLIKNEEAIGVLTVQSGAPEAYDDAEVSMLKSLASYLSIAIDNANAYRMLKSENTKTTDSLRYAQTIQQTILPSEESFKKLFQDYGLIFLPKDIVSGDFYWLTDTPDNIFVALVDCTGHGVPGAFMSMIGHTSLNEIVKQRKISEPAEILERLDRKVIKALKQKHTDNRDGMDIAICRISKNKDKAGLHEVCISAASQPVYIFKKEEQELITHERTRRSVGGMVRRRKTPFIQSSFDLREGDRIFMTTDGFSDQCSPAPERKKYGSLRLREFLKKDGNIPVSTLAEKLLLELRKHQKDAGQRDDISVLFLEL